MSKRNRTAAARRRAAHERQTRRESLFVLLSRMQRGVLLDAERPLLFAHVEAELAEGNQLRANVAGQQAAVKAARATVEAAEGAIVEAERDRDEARRRLAAYEAVFGPNAVDDFHAMQHRAKTAEQRADDAERDLATLRGGIREAGGNPTEVQNLYAQLRMWRNSAQAAEAERDEAKRRATNLRANLDALRRANVEAEREVTELRHRARLAGPKPLPESSGRPIPRGALDGCPTPETHNWGCGCATDHSAIIMRAQDAEQRAEAVEAELAAARRLADDQAATIRRQLDHTRNVEQQLAAVRATLRTTEDQLGEARQRLAQQPPRAICSVGTSEPGHPVNALSDALNAGGARDADHAYDLIRRYYNAIHAACCPLDHCHAAAANRAALNETQEPRP